MHVEVEVILSFIIIGGILAGDTAEDLRLSTFGVAVGNLVRSLRI